MAIKKYWEKIIVIRIKKACRGFEIIMLTNLDILLSEVQALLDDRKYPKVFDDMTEKDYAIVEKSSDKILKVMEKYDLLSSDAAFDDAIED